MSELQNASCGCVRAHEQPSVSRSTCRLPKTNSRLIRCWYSDCIFSKLGSLPPVRWWIKPYVVRVDAARNVQGSGSAVLLLLLLPSLLVASLAPVRALLPDAGEGHRRSYSTAERRHAPLHLCSARADARAGRPVSRKTRWHTGTFTYFLSVTKKRDPKMESRHQTWKNMF